MYPFFTRYYSAVNHIFSTSLNASSNRWASSGSGSLVRFPDGSVRVVTVFHVVDEDASIEVRNHSSTGIPIAIDSSRFEVASETVEINTTFGNVHDWVVSAELTEEEVFDLVGDNPQPVTISEKSVHAGDILTVVSRDGAYTFQYEVIDPSEDDNPGVIRIQFKSIVGDSCPSGDSLHGPGHSGGAVLYKDEVLGLISVAELSATGVVGNGGSGTVIGMPNELIIIPLAR